MDLLEIGGCIRGELLRDKSLWLKATVSYQCRSIFGFEKMDRQVLLQRKLIIENKGCICLVLLPMNRSYTESVVHSITTDSDLLVLG